MKHPLRLCLAALAFLLLTSSAHATQTYGTLLSYDFDTAAWPNAAPEAVGTIDTLGSTQPSLALRSASLITSGPLPISITETNLGKLTLAFSLSASSAKPVTVTLQSYDSSKTRTGGLQTLVYPAAPDFYQRYAVDLSTCQASGTGTFVPNAPYVSFSFSTQDASWQGVASPELRVDNVNYALPAYYVSTSGSNNNTGRSEAQAYRTPQKALDQAQAGDIVDVMAGTYTGGAATTGTPAQTTDYGTNIVAAFQRTGTPAKWIVLRNYPGQTPTFITNGWQTVYIGEVNYDPSIPLAYLEVRGLHILGEGQNPPLSKYASLVATPTSTSVHSQVNTNGISVSGDGMTYKPHHIRLADNSVEYCPGGGIGGSADWLTIENNVCSNNCFTTGYGTSGIGIIGTSNFDATDNVYKRLIRNNICYGNQTYQLYEYTSPTHYLDYSDGNGIIMDVNNSVGSNQGPVPVTDPDTQYIGRTLVQSNLCFNNGGGGVHAYRANRVDIIGNTAYMNSASPALQYAQIDSNTGDDVRIINNIAVAPVANTAAGEKPEPVNGSGSVAHNVIFSHNLYFGGNTAPYMGSGDVIADPKFVSPSRDSSVADFHLLPTSPALATGIPQPFSPFLDLDGRVRNATTPDKGAYQLLTTLSGTVSLQSWQGSPQPLTFTLTPTGSTTGAVVTQTLTPGTGGAFTLSPVPTGTYTLSVKGSKWLSKSLPADTTQGSLGGLTFALLGGDVNNDNTVTNTDYLILRNAYGKQSGQSGYDGRADLNGDNTITNTDYLILRGNYAKTGN